MKEINITIRDKIAENVSGKGYVCGNSDYTVIFDFDSEWDEFDTKTARFIKQDKTFMDVVFTGNECPMPILSNTYNIYVGVFAGDLHTTTPAHISAKKSILCDNGTPAAPSKDVYAQIMELLSNLDAEIITKTGTFIEMEAETGTDITINADTAEAVELYHAGKNLLQPTVTTDSRDGLTFEVKPNGKIAISGTLVDAGGNTYMKFIPKEDAFYLPAGTYTLSGIVPGVGWTGTVNNVVGNTSLAKINVDTSQVTFTLEEGVNAWAMFTCQRSSADPEVNATVWMQLERGETATDFMPGKLSKSTQTLPTTVEAYDGTNIFYTSTGDALTATMKVYKEEGVNEDAVNALIAEALKPTNFDPTVYDIPVLKLAGDCSEMSKENAVPLDFSFVDKDGVPFEGTATVKWQGASSVQTGISMGGLFNLTIKFPSKVELADGWGKHKKYCFKANAVDHTHARNICSCKLWGQIVKSRETVPPELTDLTNGGAIDGYPVAVMVNDEFYALGTMNTPKDEYIFTSENYAPKAIVSANDHTDATQFKGLATLDGDFDLEYAEEVMGEDGVASTDWVKTSLNTMLQTVIDYDPDNLFSLPKIWNYVDMTSAVDYYIQTVYEKASDGLDKNYLLVTFDGVKWYFSAYDRDTTYGLQWDGSTIVNAGGSVRFADYAKKHRLMEIIYTTGKQGLVSRATELRKGALSEINVCDVFSKFAAKIPDELLMQNCRRWPLLRSTSISNVAQILNWYRLRCIYIDAELNKA